MRIWKALMSVRALFVVLALGMSGAVHAGNLWLTGHDADLHCGGGFQCNHFGIAIDHGRIGAPDPTLPMLFISDNTSASADLVRAETMAAARANNSVEGAGSPFPYVIISPLDASFATLTIDVATYSAVVLASHTSCGGCDMTSAGVDAINLRTLALQAFFNDGGGLVYFSGAADRVDYYASVPIPATGAAVSSPFTLTPDGVLIGLLDPADTNCCATHNSFSLPGVGSPLVVLELDRLGLAETMIVRGGIIVDDVITDDTDDDVVSVDEPGSLGLLGLAFVTLAALRRRRRA